MKNNQVNDERVINQKRKIIAEAYCFIMIFLISSILVKQFILHAKFNEYAVEFIAFFGASIYVVMRNVFVGNDLYNENKKSLPIINSLVMGGSVTITSVFLRYKDFNTINDFILECIIAFICASVSSFLVFYIINKITQKRIRHIEKKYDDED